jgi:hypothetical protein
MTTPPVVTVFGLAAGGGWHFAGQARLELPRLLRALPDLEAAIATHPEVASGIAHIAWLVDGEPHAELIAIRAVGPIGTFQGDGGGTGLELVHASTAPTLHIPPGPGSDGFWCVLFPWASFCGGD